MKVSLRRCHFGRVLALAVVIALLPLPALADQGSAKAAPGIRVSAATIAKTEPLAASETAAQAGAPAGTDSPSFFKSPAGIVTLVLVGVGVGFALYSTKNDRINSPGR
jgi:hypothetical protein